MGSQRVNRYVHKNARGVSGQYRAPVSFNDKPICHGQTGFLRHPVGFPLEIKRKWFTARLDPTDRQHPQIGIMFDSEKYLKPGTVIEITIHMPKNLEKFTGKVVLVKHNGDHYEIGLWLSQSSDASRARIVEQVCHIEAYLREKKYREGPYNLNPERVAKEWIAKYSGGVPSF
jgi:hypothetical protein